MVVTVITGKVTSGIISTFIRNIQIVPITSIKITADIMSDGLFIDNPAKFIFILLPKISPFAYTRYRGDLSASGGVKLAVYPTNKSGTWVGIKCP